MESAPLMVISIHAPREGSDHFLMGQAGDHRPISIHAPREGSDEGHAVPVVVKNIFQSTLPVRGATLSSRS